MQQDFASSVGEKSARPSVLIRRASFRQPLSVKPVMLAAAGSVAVVFMLTLLLVGNPVGASAPVTQEEWLVVSPPKQAENQHLKKVVLQSGDAAISVLGKLGFTFAEVIRMSKA